MWTRFFSLIGIISLCSCGSKESQTYCLPDFKINSEAKKEIVVQELLVQFPYDICADNNNIYLLAEDEGKWLHVYDIKNGGNKASFVSKGQGPQELAFGYSMQIDSNNDHISIYDCSQQKVGIYELTPDTCAYDSNFSFADYSSVLDNVYSISNNVFFISGETNIKGERKCRFQIVRNGKVDSSYGHYPIEDKYKSIFTAGLSTSISPSRKRMCASTLYGGVLEFFDIEREISHRKTNLIFEPKGIFNGYGFEPNEQTIYGFSDIYATDEKVYAVMIGSKDPNANSVITTWDWNGNPIGHYRTSDIVCKICVNQNNELYAVIYNKETGYQIVKYDLNESI